MRNRRVVTALLCIVIAISGLLSTLALVTYDTSSFIRNDLITITTFIVDMLAMVISLYMFISIDTVNEVTSMEGNVLENENYSIAYSNEMRLFRNCKEQSEFATALFDSLTPVLKKSKSVIEYADNL